MAEIHLTDWKISYRKHNKLPYNEFIVKDIVSVKPYDESSESRVKRLLPAGILVPSNKDIKIEVTYKKLVGHTNAN